MFSEELYNTVTIRSLPSYNIADADVADMARPRITTSGEKPAKVSPDLPGLLDTLQLAGISSESTWSTTGGGMNNDDADWCIGNNPEHSFDRLTSTVVNLDGKR